MGGGDSFARRAAAVAAFVLVARDGVPQYKTLGPNACIACHDHARQAQKWQKDEPRELKGRAHFATRKQLEAPKSAAFAKAIGLADPYDLKGSCVTCHATVFKGDANAGVSCESCHGPASAYNEPHQAKGAYAKAITLGMADLRGKPAAIAKVCVDCHVTPDKRLAAAGHPVGEAFDAGASLRKVVHWAAAYDFAAVSAAGKKMAAARAAGAGKTAGAAAPPPPVPPPGAGAKPPAAAPGTKVPPATTAAAPATSASSGTTAEAPAAAEPWDWDQPVRALPADYGKTPETAAAADGTEATPAPTAARRKRREPPPPSIAYESPLPPPVPGGPDTSPLAPATAPAAETATKETVAPEAPLAATDARSRALALLEKALRAGAKGSNLPPAQKPTEFDGPDGELLRVQDEAMALALEALRRP